VSDSTPERRRSSAISIRAWHLAIGAWVVLCLGGLGWMFLGRAPIHTHIRAGYVHDPPYMFRRDDGQPSGAAVDVLNEAARRAGVTVEWVRIEAPANADTALRSGVVDLWPLFAVLPHRQPEFHFTDPWLQTELWIVARDGGGLPDHGFTGRVGLAPLPVAQHLVRQYFPQATQVYYADGTHLAHAICSGELTVALLAASDLGEAATSYADCRGARLRSHIVPGSKLKLAVGSVPAYAATAERLRAAIDGMASDGSIRPIVLPHSVYAASEVLAVYELLRARSQTRYFGYGLLVVTVALVATLALSAALYRADQQAKRALVEKFALEEKLHASHRLELLGQLAGGIAHDFNNLATIIIGYAALAAEEVRGSSRLSESLREIRRAGERASDLVRQLMMFSRHQLVEPQALRLHHQLEGLQPMLGRLLREDVHIELALAADEDRILIDEGQLSRVVINLVVNACDAMPAGGTIRMATSNVDAAGGRPRQVRLSVSDQGVGIPRDVQARMFEPFFTTKPVGYGTGLGLSTVHGVVTQSGGTIDVSSEPGKGSRFDITLPLLQPYAAPAKVVAFAPPTPAPATHPVPAVASRVAGSPSVLVAEDQDHVRALVIGVLRTAGYDVTDARDGAEALECLRSRRGAFDLVLSDLVMPRMTGQELFAAARAECLAPPFLFMSGYSEQALPAQSHGSGLLPKPFTPDQLLRAVSDELTAIARA